jgi:cytochrome P450
VLLRREKNFIVVIHLHSVSERMFGLILQILAAVTVIVSIYFVQKFVRQCVSLRAFPGPLAIPLVGNCYQAEALFLLRYLAKLRKRYGRMFTFFAFTKPYLVTCEPLAVRRILSDTKTFAKGVDYTELFSIAFGQGLVTSNGDRHKNDRGIFGRFFIRSSIGKCMQQFNNIVKEAIAEEFDTLAAKNNGAFAFNIEEFNAILALRMFMCLTMGQRESKEREHYLAKIVSRGSYEMGRIVGLGLPPYDFMPPVKYCKVSTKKIIDFFRPFLDARKARIDAGETVEDDILTALLTNNLSDKDIQDHVVTLMCAGHDTTAFFSSYLCFLLATNEDCQEKLRQEIYEAVGDKEEITADDCVEMKYLQKVMQETLRLYAIIPAVTRVATEDVHIKEANITIPMGTNVLIPMFLINRDPELWENPSQFNPDRFEGKGDFTSAKHGFFPFGYGSRTCIGNTLAQLETTTFMCHLLRKYNLKPKEGFKPAIMSGISLTTSNGIEIVLEPRR